MFKHVYHLHAVTKLHNAISKTHLVLQSIRTLSVSTWILFEFENLLDSTVGFSTFDTFDCSLVKFIRSGDIPMFSCVPMHLVS